MDTGELNEKLWILSEALGIGSAAMTRDLREESPPPGPFEMGETALQEIFEVCREMKRGKDYTEACKKVAEKRKRTYATIADKCTRRLGIDAARYKEALRSNQLAGLLIRQFPGSESLIRSVLG